MTWREQLAWAAGLFDGEGNVRTHARDGAKRDQIRLSITQVDRRVHDRFAAIVGVGKVYGPYKQSKGHQDHHQFIAVDFNNVQAIIAIMWHWLSPVKRVQAENALRRATHAARSAPPMPGARPTCARGHAYDYEIRQKRGRFRLRMCRACRRETYRVRRDTRRTVAALLEA